MPAKNMNVTWASAEMVEWRSIGWLVETAVKGCGNR